MKPWCAAAVVSIAIGIPSAAFADAAAPSASGSAAPAGIKTKPPLPELPKLPKIGLGEPKKEVLDELDRLLQRVTSEDESIRETATRELLEIDEEFVAAIDARMNALADDADRGALKRTLSKVRREARKAVRERMKAEGKRGKVVTPDYLEMLTRHARPDSDSWKQLTQVVAMSRMLRHLGTVTAVRELIDVYVRFGELLRVDTQLQLEKLGDAAIPALIETRRHQAAKIGRWANRQLDALGKAIPSEAVQVTDTQVLADVLRAYGRIKDPDAARVVIAFANSERAQVRLAARQSVAMMGEVANWQLRDTYLNIVGKKPPRDWSWERTAREMFGEFDRLRLSRVYGLYDEGLAALEAKDFDKMGAAFDKVLARDPVFEHRGKMAPGYVELAHHLADSKPSRAIDALRRAERLSGEGTAYDRAKSLRLTLEGEALLDRGIADQVMFRRALELDGNNERARAVLDRIQRGEVEQETRFYRYLGAAAIALVALVAMAFIALRRRSKAPATAE